jgi:hypothetical protein
LENVIKGVLLDPGMLLSLEESGFEPRDVIISVRGDLGWILIYDGRMQCKRGGGVGCSV